MPRSQTISTPSAATAGHALSPLLTALIDLVVITVFVLIGRSSHDEPLDVLGILQTLWPFVVSAAAGWSVVYVFSHVRSSDMFRADFRPERAVPQGVVIWFFTVTVAMILRYLLHQGVAVSFVIVAASFLALFLIGWRAAYTAVRRRTA